MTLIKITQFSIGPIGAGILGVITLPIITWYFNSEDIGRLSIAQASLQLIVLIISLGMNQAYVREYHEEDDKLSLFKMVVFPSLALFLLILLISYFMPISISYALFGIESVFNSFLIILASFCLLIINFLVHMLRMQEQALTYSVTQILPRSIFLLLVGVVVTTHFLSISFNTLLFIHVFAIVFTLIVLVWITRTTWIPSIIAKTNNKKVKDMLLFSLPLVGGSIAFWGITAMDRFFLRSLSSFSELGLYSVAISFAGAATMLSMLFTNVWQPILYKWIKDGVDPERIQRVIEYVVLAVSTIWCMAGLFSWIILYAIPDEYNNLGYLLVVCMVYPLMYLLSEATKVGIGISRKSSFSMLASVVAFIVNAILNYILIPELGAKGAAIASAIAFFIFFVIRTESSAYLWISLPRRKIYFLVVSLLSATFYMVYTDGKSEYNSIMWIYIWLLGNMLYFSRIKECMSGLIKSKLKIN